MNNSKRRRLAKAQPRRPTPMHHHELVALHAERERGNPPVLIGHACRSCGEPFTPNGGRSNPDSQLHKRRLMERDRRIKPPESTGDRLVAWYRDEKEEEAK